MAALAAVVGGAAIAHSWIALGKEDTFAKRIKMSLKAGSRLMDAREGYGSFKSHVTAEHNPDGAAVEKMVKGDMVVVADLPHTIVNRMPVADHAEAQAHPGPGSLRGTVKIAHMMQRVPVDVFELVSSVPVDGHPGQHQVVLKLIRSIPPVMVVAGFTPDTTPKDMEGTLVSLVWKSDIDFVLRPTMQMYISCGGTVKVTGKRSASDQTGAGKTAGIFNGEMTDMDGCPLYCLDKANYRKEEEASRPFRRALVPERALAFLGEKGYVLNEPKIRRELLNAFRDPMGTSRPSWADKLTNLSAKVHTLPVWEEPKRFEALLRCEGTMGDPTTLSLRHCLPSEVKYDVNSAAALEVALSRLDCVLAFALDPSFLKLTSRLCERLSGGDLEFILPTHLWYAGERAFVQWQRTMRGEVTGSNEQFRLEVRTPGLAATVLVECLEENFALPFLQTVKDNWSIIQRQLGVEMASVKAAASPKPAAPDQEEVKEKKAKGEGPEVRMCTSHARLELKVLGSTGCKNAACSFQHYKLASMGVEKAKETITKHASEKQRKPLLAAAELLLKR